MELRRFIITIKIDDEVPKAAREDVQTQLLNHIWPAAKCQELCEELVKGLPYEDYIEVIQEEA